MRLISTFSLQFEEFPDAASGPPYIILSHIWTGNEEISYKGMLNAAHKSSQNYAMIEDFARYIQQNIPWIILLDRLLLRQQGRQRGDCQIS